MTLSNDRPASKNHAAPISLEADPSLMRMGNDTDYEHPENPQPMRPHEFIVTTGANSIMFVSGLKITLDSVIRDENRTYDHCVRAFHEEVASGVREPGDTLAEMIGGEDTGLADLTIWGCGGRVAAVLVPRLDGSGYEVTRFTRDRAHPGPIAPPRKVVPMSTDTTLPTVAQNGSCYVRVALAKPGPWRLFLVCWRGKAEGVYAGHGLVPEDVVDDLVRNLKDDDGPDEPSNTTPESYTIFEGVTLIATVRNLDGKGRTETTWVDPCDSQTLPWRSFKVDREGGGFSTVIEGNGTLLDEAIAEAVREIRMMASSRVEPDDLVIIEDGRVVCHVLVRDVITKVTWDEREEQDNAIADAKGVHIVDTPGPKPLKEIAYAALEVSTAVGELEVIESLSDGSVIFAGTCDRLEEAEKALTALMRERGIPAVVVEGRMYVCPPAEEARKVGPCTRTVAIVSVEDIANAGL